jgi:hypothetical protein
MRARIRCHVECPHCGEVMREDHGLKVISCRNEVCEIYALPFQLPTIEIHTLLGESQPVSSSGIKKPLTRQTKHKEGASV